MTDYPLAVIDGATNTVTKNLAYTAPIGFIAINPLTNMVYANPGGPFGATTNNVSVINGATNTVVKTLSVAGGANAFAVNTVTNTIYVAGSPVTVIDGATNTVATTVADGGNASTVAVNPVTNTVYVANYDLSLDGMNYGGTNCVTVIDGATNAVTATVPTGAGGYASNMTLGVNTATNTIYVANQGANSTTVILSLIHI